MTKKRKPKQPSIEFEYFIREKFSLEEFASMVSRSVPTEFAAKFIALLDISFQEWSVTADLIQHFESQRIEYLEECLAGQDQEEFEKFTNLKPKNLLKDEE